MNVTRPGYSPLRAGEVVGFNVRADDPRPVTIECHGHAHNYEIAWHQTPDGPVITDLRVTSTGGIPITSESLRRINTDRLARTAAIHDTPAAADSARALRQAIDRASGTTEGHDWIEQSRPTTAGLLDAMIRHAPPEVTLPAPPRRRGGRPRHSPEFLAQVAAWAREASAEGHSVYPYVAECAAAAGRPAGLDTVKVWIRRCKEAGLLGPDELRRPRTATTKGKRR